MMRTCLLIVWLGFLIPAQAQRLSYHPPGFPQSTNPPPASVHGRILIPGDTIEVRVFQEDDLNTRVRIEQDGTISMPLLGVVRVGGKTSEQAREMIHDLLLKKYLQKPEVSLTVVDPAKRRFCILGEVRQPGYYEFPENEKLNLLQAISLAGGYTSFAQPKKISIKRMVGGIETVRVVDAKAMVKKNNVAIVQIEPNDTIMVSEHLF